MSVYEIKTVSVGLISPNPFRDLGTYPWIERKVEQLQSSIAGVGFWAGVIARPMGKRYQLAFGHHRIEAAKRNKIAAVPLILDALTDEQMLQFMGRENGEDYNAEFLVMLNTWEAAENFLDAPRIRKRQPIEIARLLGWTNPRHVGMADDQMNHTARACYSAAALIRGGYLSRDELNGLNVMQVEHITGAAFNRMQQAENAGKRNKATAKQIDEAKAHIGKAASYTAKRAVDGHLARSDLRASVDVNAYRFARQSKQASPLFAMFARTAIEQIERILNSDTTAEKLAEIIKAIPDITENEDRQAVQRIDLALEQLAGRAQDWRSKLNPKRKVVPLAAITGKGA
jgi:hypothetical protein